MLSIYFFFIYFLLSSGPKAKRMIKFNFEYIQPCHEYICYEHTAK